jgi:hypothetical protein
LTIENRDVPVSSILTPKPDSLGPIFDDREQEEPFENALRPSS